MNVKSEAGAPDPHASHYDCERAKLTTDSLTDDELSNGALMSYDQAWSVINGIGDGLWGEELNAAIDARGPGDQRQSRKD